MKCEHCGYEQPCPVCGTLPPASGTQGYELWIDVYQGNDADDWALLKENGVVGVCAKIGRGQDGDRGWSGSILDNKFQSHIDSAKVAGMKTAGYWWANPLESWSRQADTCINAVKDAGLDWIAVDMEVQKGWQQKYNKKKQKYIWEFSLIDGTKQAACVKFLLDKFKVALNIPVYLYTRTEFIVNNAPQVLDWIAEYPLWIVGSPYQAKITNNRLEAIAKSFIYCGSWQEWRDKYAIYPDGKWKPLLPKGKDWDIWQFSFDSVKLPGAKSYLDLNWKRI
jgi:GH25 family lysozyme M1 (1,4-beta-N-acetylmuramidase)